MSRKFTLAALAALAIAMPAASQAAAGRVQDPREAYHDNLVACIGRSARCDRSALVKDDRDYLVYEMRSQRFDPVTVAQVADVRMEAYDRTYSRQVVPAPVAPAVTQDMVDQGAALIRGIERP